MMLRKRRLLSRMPRVAILLESTHEMSRGLLRGIAKWTHLHGPWGLHVIMGGENEQCLPAVDRWKATGIIAKVHNERTAKMVLAAKLPTVLFDPLHTFLERNPPSFCRVVCDDREIGRLAAEHFLERKFEHFAFVPELRRTDWTQTRVEVFTEYLAKEGKTVFLYKNPVGRNADWGDEFKTMIRWLRRLPKPVAVFTSHDLRARQVLDACLIGNIDVPREVAVLGVGNDELVPIVTTPALSSIAVDTESGGFAAAEMLESLMHGLEPVQREFLYRPKGVIARASTERITLQDSFVSEARELIRINSGFGIQVADIAKRLKLSRRSLEMRFAKAIGHSVLSEIQQVRLESLLRLVGHSELPFGKIAEISGLSNVTYLGKLFKQEFGVTMSEYRQEIQRKEEK